MGYADLFPTTEPTTVPLSDIADQRAVDPGEYPADFIAHIRERGLPRPILLASANGGGPPYRALVEGHLIPAFKQARLETLQAIVYEADGLRAARDKLVTRSQRSRDPLERACLCQEPRQLADLTVEEAADLLGASALSVNRYLNFLDLPPFLQRLLARGVLGTAHALACAEAPAEKLEPLTHTILQHRLSQRETSRLVKMVERFPKRPVADLTEEMMADRAQ